MEKLVLQDTVKVPCYTFSLSSPPPPKKNMMNNSFFFSPLLSCRYVVRAKSGRKQSSKDASGKGVHSAGASLRRHNEFALKKVFNAKVVAIAVF